MVCYDSLISDYTLLNVFNKIQQNLLKAHKNPPALFPDIVANCSLYQKLRKYIKLEFRDLFNLKTVC